MMVGLCPGFLSSLINPACSGRANPRPAAFRSMLKYFKAYPLPVGFLPRE